MRGVLPRETACLTIQSCRRNITLTHLAVCSRGNAVSFLRWLSMLILFLSQVASLYVGHRLNAFYDPIIAFSPLLPPANPTVHRLQSFILGPNFERERINIFIVTSNLGTLNWSGYQNLMQHIPENIYLVHELAPYNLELFCLVVVPHGAAVIWDQHSYHKHLLVIDIVCDGNPPSGEIHK